MIDRYNLCISVWCEVIGVHAIEAALVVPRCAVPGTQGFDGKRHAEKGCMMDKSLDQLR
jgi:hypothetical protein